jgi:hypothetical protein
MANKQPAAPGGDLCAAAASPARSRRAISSFVVSVPDITTSEGLLRSRSHQAALLAR